MSFRFAPPPHAPALDALRAEVRDFLHQEMPGLSIAERAKSWHGFSPEFSRKVAARGWIGMTWPRDYGGGGRSMLERYVVIEEMLAAGAPVGAHWSGDRQSGPMLIRYATEAQRQDILPRVAAGECFFCIGMSEPNAGSDLAGITTRARRAADGWVVNGAKIWTTNAHRRHYMILLARTAPAGESRHAGMSQFLVDLTKPGITIRPIRNMAGEHHFNEVVFTDCHLAADALLGTEGEGWKQVTGELGYERSGPERFLTSYLLLQELVRRLGEDPSERARIALGRAVAHLSTLRRMSFSLAGALQAGENVTSDASLVKDLGGVFEQWIPEMARGIVEEEAVIGDEMEDSYSQALFQVMLHAPSFSIYGGTREILRGIIARNLGLR